LSADVTLSSRLSGRCKEDAGALDAEQHRLTVIAGDDEVTALVAQCNALVDHHLRHRVEHSTACGDSIAATKSSSGGPEVSLSAPKLRLKKPTSTVPMLRSQFSAVPSSLLQSGRRRA